MKFLKVSKTILNSLLYLQAIPVCTCSAVPAGKNADLGHTATGQSHDCKIDPPRPAYSTNPNYSPRGLKLDSIYRMTDY